MSPKLPASHDGYDRATRAPCPLRKVASQMDVKWERKDETAVARVEGRIDGANFWDFQSVLESGVDPDVETVLVDFDQVAFISSAGLRVVLMLGKQLRKRGAKLAVCSLNDSIRRIFEVSGFDRIVPVHGSETQAIDAFTSPPEPVEAAAGALRSEIDFDIVGDNLKDIAGFTLDKYEYINDCTLPPQTRQKAMARINDALWRCVEQSKRERLLLLQRMFVAAADALEETVGAADD